MNRTCKELSNTVMLIALCAGLGASACQPSAQKEHLPQAKGQQALIIDGVWVPDEYPVNQYLSAPFIPQPVHACAEVVLVQGTLENAIVTVYDDQGQVLGTATADGDDVEVSLSRALLDGEYIFATQAVGQTTSAPSARRFVAAFSDPLPPPILKEQIWTCGRLITVNGTVPGAKVVLSHQGNDFASRNVSKTATSPWVNPQVDQGWANDFAQARQIMCPKGDAIVSPLSNEQLIENAPSPMPPILVTSAKVGSRKVLKKSFVGANVKIFDRGNQVSNTHQTYAESFATLATPIQPDWEITATHELCEESEPIPIPLLPIEALEEELAKNPPKVLGPICPGATQIRVRPGVGEGRLILKKDGNYVSQAQAGGGVTQLSLAQGVQTGEVLTAFHILQGNPDLVGATSAGETVSAGRELTILGEKTLVDQDTSQPFSGFVKEENDFPRFDLVDCNCQEPGQGPSKLEGKIYVSGESSPHATITLYEQYSGYYNGHWNWLVGNPPVDALKASYEIRIEPPCGGDKFIEKFVLVSGEVDTSDSTAPALTLKVNGQATSGMLSVTKDEMTISATASDSEGVESVVIAEGGIIRGQKIAQPVAPIPGELSTSYTLELLPLTPVTINATGANFANTQASQSVTITREMPTPSLTTVPGPMFSRKATGGANTFDISGKNLHFSNLTTTVTLTSTTNPSLSGTIQIAGSANNGHTSTKLNNLTWPMSLYGKAGVYDVSISLNSPGGVASAASNTKQMTLKDRRGPFTKYEIDDFTNNTRSCNGGSGSKIVGVTIGLQPGSSNTHTATFESDTGVPFNDSYNSYDLPDGVSVGGVALSPDCKYGLILTKVGGNAVADGPFDVVFVYLDEDGDFQVTNSGSGILLWSYYIPMGANGSLGTTVQMFSTLVSEDRTILVFNSSDVFASELNIKVNSSVFDALKNISLTTGQNADCPSLSSCDVSASISNGRRVDVELNGNAMYNEKID